MNTDEKHASHLKLAMATQRVMRKRHDFEAAIFTGYREMMSQMSGVDPYMKSSQLQIDLKETGEPIEAAQLQLVGALLHVWYKVTPELKGMVNRAVRELAMIDGVDEMVAVMEADLILSDARSSSAAMAELQAKVDKKYADRQRARKKRDDQQMRYRLAREA